MVFGVAKRISYVSQFMTLGIDGLGEQRQAVIAFKR